MSVETETQAAEKKQAALGIKIWFRLPTITIPNSALVEDFRLEGITTDSGNPIDHEWILKNIGISQRYKEPGQPHLDIPFNSLTAAKKTLEAKGWLPNEVDFIGATTSFPVGQNLAKFLKERLSFSTNAQEQEELKAEILEVNAACAGFTVLLHYLKENEGNFLGKKILLVAAEQYSPYLYGLDRAIFSDFTLGMAFEYGKDLRVLESQLVYENDDEGSIRMPIQHHNSPPFLSYEIPPSERFFEMKGQKVFKWVGDNVPPVVNNLVEQSNFQDIKLLIPHQANQRITNLTQKKVSVPVYSNIENRGNTSSASIPLALFDAQQEGLIKKGDKVIFVGFGAGLLICADIVQISS